MAFNPAAMLAGSVRQIRIESAWLPPIVMDAPFADSPPSPAVSAIGRLFKPVVVTTLSGGYEHRSAPYGEPGASKWPLVQVGLALGMVVLGAWILYPKRKGLK